MCTNEPSLAEDHRSALMQQWCTRTSTNSQSTKTSEEANASSNLVGAYDSGTHPAVRYVYHPSRPSEQPSTRFTSRCGMLKERNYPRATSAGSFTHVVRKDMENEKSQSLLPARSMILVSPGHEARLRGAAETFQAIQQDFYLACVCFDCQAPLFCIFDAWLVLCPHCRVLSPIYHSNGDVAMNQEGGVGLGFTMETLMEV
jgi:hypothetical protein